LAQSFARIFFRNAINIALPVMVCPGINAAFKDGDELEVDIDSGIVKNLTSGKSLTAEALPPNIQHILKQGGLVEVTKAKLAARGTS
jgi:3-isopropylmalate/(R)-2-methylmalate dehydratase small subunit